MFPETFEFDRLTTDSKIVYRSICAVAWAWKVLFMPLFEDTATPKNKNIYWSFGRQAYSYIKTNHLSHAWTAMIGRSICTGLSQTTQNTQKIEEKFQKCKAPPVTWSKPNVAWGHIVSDVCQVWSPSVHWFWFWRGSNLRESSPVGWPTKHDIALTRMRMWLPMNKHGNIQIWDLLASCVHQMPTCSMCLVPA
jgi:hypothetical protein